MVPGSNTFPLAEPIHDLCGFELRPAAIRVLCFSQEMGGTAACTGWSLDTKNDLQSIAKLNVQEKNMYTNVPGVTKK